MAAFVFGKGYPLTLVLDGSGNESLANAGFSLYQDNGILTGDPAEMIENTTNGSAFPYEVLEA